MPKPLHVIPDAAKAAIRNPYDRETGVVDSGFAPKRVEDARKRAYGRAPE
jgi:hypothetical protein